MAANARILVIRFSSFGDIVLTTPVVRCLHTQFDAEIHYLVKEEYKDALQGNPHIDRVIAVPQGMMTATILNLREMRYDWIIDLHHNLRSWVVKRALGVPARSFRKLNFEKWLMVNFKKDRLPDMHIVDRYFETVQHLNVHDDGRGLDFFPERESATATVLHNQFAQGQFIALAIGAGMPTKCLEQTQLDRLLSDLQCPVVLLGGPDDHRLGEELAARHVDVVNFAGKLSLVQSAAVIQDAALLITPDTGLMHIAAALDKPVISYWGNTIPEFGMTPFYPDDSKCGYSVYQVTDLPCRPCSKIGHQRCPQRHFRCIRDQDLTGMTAEATRICEGPAGGE